MISLIQFQLLLTISMDAKIRSLTVAESMPYCKRMSAVIMET